MNDYRDRLTQTAREAIGLAQDEAHHSQHACVGTEHILLGVLRSDGVGARVLESFNIEYKQVLGILKQDSGMHEQLGDCLQGLTPQATDAITCAYEEAQALGSNYIGTAHVLLGLLRQGDGTAAKTLAALDVLHATALSTSQCTQDQVEPRSNNRVRTYARHHTPSKKNQCVSQNSITDRFPIGRQMAADDSSANTGPSRPAYLTPPILCTWPQLR